MFQQVPMVEIDGMKLIQTKAILQYIAEKYNLHGKDIKDRVMYAHFFYTVFLLYGVILAGECVTVYGGAFPQDQHVHRGTDGSHGDDHAVALHCRSKTKTGQHSSQSDRALPSSVRKGISVFPV